MVEKEEKGSYSKKKRKKRGRKNRVAASRGEKIRQLVVTSRDAAKKSFHPPSKGHDLRSKYK